MHRTTEQFWQRYPNCHKRSESELTSALACCGPTHDTRHCSSRRSVRSGVTFFELGKTWLALWSRESRAADAGLSSEGSGFQGFSLAHNVRSPAVYVGSKVVLEPTSLFHVPFPRLYTWARRSPP